MNIVLYCYKLDFAGLFVTEGCSCLESSIIACHTCAKRILRPWLPAGVPMQSYSLVPVARSLSFYQPIWLIVSYKCHRSR